METVRIDDVDRRWGPAAEKRPVSRALGTEHVALNYYELEPGDSLAFGYHHHENQEEVFYVQDGSVTFETEEGDVTVERNQVARFAPGEWQRGTNEASERAVVLAVGAPREAGETAILRACGECGERTLQEIERAGTTTSGADPGGATDEGDGGGDAAGGGGGGGGGGEDVDDEALVTLCIDCGTETGRFT